MISILGTQEKNIYIIIYKANLFAGAKVKKESIEMWLFTDGRKGNVKSN